MTVATLERSPEVLARRSGLCPVCSERIRKGVDYIVKVEPKGWMHATCAAEYRRHLEHLADLKAEHGLAEAGEED